MILLSSALRKIRRRYIVGAVALAAGCGGDGTSPPSNTVPAIGSVEIPQPNAALTIGQTMQLDAVVRSTSGTIIAASVAWQSNDPSIVQVSVTGLATAVAPGTATVTAAATNATTTSPVSGSTTVSVATPNLLARRAHAMTFDAGRRRVLLFGGIGPLVPGGVVNDQSSTWAFDGTRWSLVSLGATGLASRNSTTMAYDQGRDVSVVFGGRSGTAPNAPAYGDTWELSGTTWTQRAPGGPAARSHATSAFDPAAQRVIYWWHRSRDARQLLRPMGVVWAGSTRTPNVTAPTAGTFGGALVAASTALYLMLSRRVIVGWWHTPQPAEHGSFVMPPGYLPPPRSPLRAPGGGVPCSEGRLTASLEIRGYGMEHVDAIERGWPTGSHWTRNGLRRRTKPHCPLRRRIGCSGLLPTRGSLMAAAWRQVP
ncbi:MAG: Ig-like domain-containing protein [Gemmatimonadaceae bacterium]